MKKINVTSEVRLDDAQEQIVIALAERRDRIAEQANEQIAKINAALGQSMAGFARQAQLAGEQFEVEAREDGLWLHPKADAETQ